MAASDTGKCTRLIAVQRVGVQGGNNGIQGRGERAECE